MSSFNPSSELNPDPHSIVKKLDLSPSQSEERKTFKNFRYNLRQYTHGNFSDMHNNVRYLYFDDSISLMRIGA